MQEDVDAIDRSLRLLEAIQAGFETATFEDQLNATALVGRGSISDLAVDSLITFVESGNRAEIQIRQGEWDGRVLSASPTTFDISAEGPWEDAFPDAAAISEGKRAVEAQDLRAFLTSIGHLDAAYRLTLLNDRAKSGFQWLRKVAVIQELIARDTWLGFIKLLFSPSVPQRLVVHDAGSAVISAAGLSLHGPDVFPGIVQPPGNHGEDYARAWLRADQLGAPPPRWIDPIESDGLEDIEQLLHGISACLCWLWLAVNAEVHDSEVVARFEGLRPVELPVELNPTTDSDDALALWEWSTSSTDALRRESVQQAISLSIRDARDLIDGFGPVLRTARYLLRISQQGIVAEALATRRTAREAAMAIARESGDAARSSVRKAFDRVLLQLGAAVGILLANREALLDKSTATWLLIAVLVFAAITAIATFTIEFPSVTHGLKAFELDLQHYRDTLPEEDLSHIREMATLTDARNQVRRSRTAALILIVKAALAASASLFVVTDTTSADDNKPRSTATSNSTSHTP